MTADPRLPGAGAPSDAVAGEPLDAAVTAVGGLLARRPGRLLVGVAGPPGAGKSTAARDRADLVLHRP
jgi:pantothenate kinase